MTSRGAAEGRVRLRQPRGRRRRAAVVDPDPGPAPARLRCRVVTLDGRGVHFEELRRRACRSPAPAFVVGPTWSGFAEPRVWRGERRPLSSLAASVHMWSDMPSPCGRGLPTSSPSTWARIPLGCGATGATSACCLLRCGRVRRPSSPSTEPDGAPRAGRLPPRRRPRDPNGVAAIPPSRPASCARRAGRRRRRLPGRPCRRAPAREAGEVFVEQVAAAHAAEPSIAASSSATALTRQSVRARRRAVGRRCPRDRATAPTPSTSCMRRMSSA